MPFTDRSGDIACRFQQLRERQLLQGQDQSRIIVINWRSRIVSNPLLIAAGDESGPRWAAIRVRGISIGAERAIGRHGIDVRRWDVQASIETDISITQVIR